MSFKFIDLFAGIGGFRLALESLGGVCTASSEIASDAISVYRKNWPDQADHNLGDICSIKDLPEHDLLVGGVPCQSWSIAGKNKGVHDPRGKLWLEVIRLVARFKPKAFLFENVKGLADPRHRESLNFIIDSFKNSGYHVEYKVLNSFDFGVPQNRDRIFIVGIRKDLNCNFAWPKAVNKHKCLFEILDLENINFEHQNQVQRDLFGNRVNVGFNKLTPKGQKNKFFIFTDIRNGNTSIHSWDLLDISKELKEVCLTILKNRRKPAYGSSDGNPMSYSDIKSLLPNIKVEDLESLIEKKILKRMDKKFEFVNRRMSGGINGIYRIYLPESTFFSTLTASGTKDMVATSSFDSTNLSDTEYKQSFIENIIKTNSFRPLFAHEFARIQGFPQTFALHNSYQKNVKLFGNSVSVPVVKSIAKNIIPLFTASFTH